MNICKGNRGGSLVRQVSVPPVVWGYVQVRLKVCLRHVQFIYGRYRINYPSGGGDNQPVSPREGEDIDGIFTFVL